MSFDCLRCGQVFTRKDSLKKHLRRKIPCELRNVEKKRDHRDKSITNDTLSKKKGGSITLVSQPEEGVGIVTCKNNDKLDRFTKKTQKNLTISQKKICESQNQVYKQKENTVNRDQIRSSITLTKKIKLITDNKGKSLYICGFCDRSFSHKNNLYRHQKHYCHKKTTDNVKKSDDAVISKLRDQIEEMKQDISELRDRKLVFHQNVQNNQNVLQVLCVGSNDNYLDMLTEKWDFQQALEYVKNCALSDINGDCKLLQKVYFPESQSDEFPIRYLDRTRNKIEYLDENRQRVVDVRGVTLGKKLANNLQNSYLKGINHLVTNNLEKRLCPLKFLGDYDVQSWNRHIYRLSDPKYQKQLISHLDIPYSNE